MVGEMKLILSHKTKTLNLALFIDIKGLGVFIFAKTSFAKLWL